MSAFSGALGEFMDYYKTCPVLHSITKADVGKSIFMKNPYATSIVGHIDQVTDKGFKVVGFSLASTGIFDATLFIEFSQQIYHPVLVDVETVLCYARRVLEESLCQNAKHLSAN